MWMLPLFQDDTAAHRIVLETDGSFVAAPASVPKSAEIKFVVLQTGPTFLQFLRGKWALFIFLFFLFEPYP